MLSMKNRLITSLFLFSLFTSSIYAYQLPTAKDPLVNSGNVQVLERISKGVSDLSEEASKAIVFISVSKIVKGRPYGEIDPFDFFFGPRFRSPQQGPREEERQQSGLGSGFFIDLDRGYIITNNHVIDGADEISIKLANGETYIAKVLGSDRNTDVAVIQIKDEKFQRKGLSQLHLGNSDGLKVGEFVLALGAPFGLEASLSFGVISATGRGNLNITSLGNFLQTDAAINPGNSGGPLIDMNGHVIGMNTAIYSRSGASAGIGFAVPSNLVRQIATQLISKGAVSRGYLGVQLAQDLDDDLTAALNLPKNTKGALISRVEANTPASKAGLESGDVITAVNGNPIRSRQDLTNAIGLLSPGTTINVDYMRNGKKRSTKVAITEFPSQEKLASTPQQQGDDEKSNPFAGMSLESLDQNRHRDWISQYGIESRRGLLVTDISANSKAAAAGIRPGDVLLEANRTPLQSPQDFSKVFAKNRRILVQLERGGAYLFASLRR
ncbi:MAG: Do family serine endopeptidase [Oligoflexus sp.]